MVVVVVLVLVHVVVLVVLLLKRGQRGEWQGLVLAGGCLRAVGGGMHATAELIRIQCASWPCGQALLLLLLLLCRGWAAGECMRPCVLALVARLVQALLH